LQLDPAPRSAAASNGQSRLDSHRNCPSLAPETAEIDRDTHNFRCKKEGAMLPSWAIAENRADAGDIMPTVDPKTAAVSGPASQPTIKHIVLLSDGTGNSAASLFRTNVRRLYEALDLEDPQKPREPRQFAFYDDGVGTSSFRPLALLGGAIGLGLARNVRELYAFLCRTYSPGDKIYAFGFSRGAFTIRVLTGLILDQGIVRYHGSEAELDRNVAAAWRDYRRHYKTRAPIKLDVGVRAIRDLIIRDSYDKKHNFGPPGSADAIRITFLGLWDTVDAYGLPIDELTRAWDRFIWRLTMRDLDLNDRVERARHALAIDDERNTFHPRLWNEAKEKNEGNTTSTSIDDERISQVWFAGVHANVGGGYADDSLAYVPLLWMMTEAKKYGLRFRAEIWDIFRAIEDESGPINDSRRGLAGYYRYNPRRIDTLCRSKDVTVARPKVHESVLRRIQIGQDGYAPFVLPPDFAVMKIDGTIVRGGDYLQAETGPAAPFAIDREHVWNWVWWRRLVYFATLGTTFVLALMPVLLSDDACSSRFCFASNWIRALGAVLPAFAETWTISFASNPSVFLLLALLIAGGVFAGRWLSRKIRDEMRLIWYRIQEVTPDSVRAAGAAPHPMRVAIPQPAPPGPVNRFIECVRLQPWYQPSFRLLTHWILPFVFLLAIAYGAIALTSQIVFAIADSMGSVCDADAPKPSGPLVFRTNQLCARTGVELRQGAAYRIRFTIPADDLWTDNGILAGPNGVHPENVTIRMTALVPLRRHLSEPWFKPMARIGAKGSDDYPLDPKPPLEAVTHERLRDRPLEEMTFTTEIVARQTGELFLYVNDAVFPSFYKNNTGSAQVTVEQLLPPAR
jgi:uncharacterized protein (DUF2235 family)